MVRDIRVAEQWLGTDSLYIEKGVMDAKVKLERSIASKRLIGCGEIISENDIHLLSPGDGYKWIDRGSVIGNTAIQDIPADEIIYPEMIS